MKLIPLGLFVTVVMAGCSSEGAGSPGSTGGAASASGGSAAVSGGSSSLATGGIANSGGNPASGGFAAITGGAPASTGGSANGGTAPSGGTTSSGGASMNGGTVATGGTVASAGQSASGGSTANTGGAGGKSASGGSAQTGGSGGAGNGGAGNGGATATGGGGGGDGYRPCTANPCTVMPLGDSITWGVGDEGNGGYRGPLFASIVAAGQKVTFTGSVSNGPTNVSGQMFPKRNEGHSGWGISRTNPNSGGSMGITTLIPSPAFSSGSGGVPNIILLHIGTNDSSFYTAAELTSDLSGFIDKVISNAPDAYLVVAQIIPLGYGTNDVIKAYNQSIPGLVQQRASAGKHIALVDMFTGFNASTMLATDKVHPNASGYKFMADRWYSAISSMLPK